MDLYYTLAGALVLGTLLLIGSATVLVITRAPRAARALRQRFTRASIQQRRALLSGLGVAVAVALWLGLASLSFQSAFDRTPQAFVPPSSVEWEPAGEQPSTSFDRFEYGTVSNAALSRRS